MSERKVPTYTINEAVEALTLVPESCYRELEKSHDAILAAAEEMFDLLSRTPSGPRWPTEEEFVRNYIRWSQRIKIARAQ